MQAKSFRFNENDLNKISLLKNSLKLERDLEVIRYCLTKVLMDVGYSISDTPSKPVSHPAIPKAKEVEPEVVNDLIPSVRDKDAEMWKVLEKLGVNPSSSCSKHNGSSYRTCWKNHK